MFLCVFSYNFYFIFIFALLLLSSKTMRLMLRFKLWDVRLQIEKEKLFTDISHRHCIALCWEEKAKHVLSSRAHICDFEDMLRYLYFVPTSNCLCVRLDFEILNLIHPGLLNVLAWFHDLFLTSSLQYQLLRRG